MIPVHMLWVFDNDDKKQVKAQKHKNMVGSQVCIIYNAYLDATRKIFSTVMKFGGVKAHKCFQRFIRWTLASSDFTLISTILRKPNYDFK